MTTKQDFTYQAVDLRQGLRLHAVRTEQFKTASLILQFAVPLRIETACVYSLLTEILSRGCERYPTMQDLSRAQDDLYALGLNITASYIGEMQTVSFELSCIEDAFTLEKRPLLQESIQLLKEVLFRPLLIDGYFHPDYVEQEKKNLSDLIAARINDKNHLARLRCLLHMCKDEPYSVSARTTPDMVARITPQQLLDAYRHLIDEAPAGMVYAGRKSAEEVASLLNDFPLSPRADFRMPPLKPVCPSEVRVIREQAHINQCKLVMGYRLGGLETIRKRCAFQLFHHLFGGASINRLFTNVREKQGLCYDCFGIPSLQRGLYFAVSGTQNEQADRLMRSIEAERIDIAEGHITDDELNRGKKAMIHEIRELLDSPVLFGALQLRAAMSGEIFLPDERIRVVEDLRAEEVMEAARHMKPDTFFFLEGVSS